MAFDYARSRATAARLIARFGQAGSIRRTIVAGGNPADPSSGSETVTEAACTLVVTDYSLRERESTLIGASDKRVLVAVPVVLPAYPDDNASEDRPTPRDRIVIGSAVHEIVRVDPLSPAGLVVLWECQVTF